MEQQISSDLIRGHIDTIILHTLIDGDKFAQQISDFIDEKSNNEYKINQATLYSSLKRLEGLKHVKSYWNDSDTGRRKYFALTESGKNFVNNNTSNWSYSRAILDRLMDCKSEPVTYSPDLPPKIIEIEKILEVPKEVIVEKIVEVEKNVEVPVVVQKQNDNVSKTTPSSSVFPAFTADNNVLNKDNDVLNKRETAQEINFRNILNALIKATTVQKKVEVEELQPLIMQDNVDTQPFEKINVMPVSNSYSIPKTNNSDGNIDYGDLMIKAAKEGYKIKVSSKKAYAQKGTLLINRLNFASTLITCLFAIMSILLICLNNAKGSVYNKVILWSGLAIPTALIVYTAVKIAMQPMQTSPKNIYPDSILTAAIVAFNVALISFAINLLLGVDFSNLNIIMFSFVLPVIWSVLAIGYFALRWFFDKIRYFHKLK